MTSKAWYDSREADDEEFYPDDLMKYIADIASELAQLAVVEGRDELAQLLERAVEEAQRGPASLKKN